MMQIYAVTGLLYPRCIFPNVSLRVNGKYKGRKVKIQQLSKF